MHCTFNSRIGRIIEFIAYGHEILDLKDPVFSAQIEAMEDFIKASSPGAFLVDALPFCPSILHTALL